MALTTTFSVGWILEELARQEGLNVTTENIDDVCFGFVISSDKTALQVFRENSSIYNYQIVDGDPIRLVRRAVNDDLVIDFEIDETDCIRRGGAPAVALSRLDPATLPRQVEIQHMDLNRDFAYSTQVARHTAAPTTNTQISIAIDFIISAQQARDMAFDLLYRIWSQQLIMGFEHPDMTIEPGDVIRLTTREGIFTCIVAGQTLNMPARTNSIRATILLTSKATTVVTAPEGESFSETSIAVLTEDGASPTMEVLTEDGVIVDTEGTESVGGGGGSAGGGSGGGGGGTGEITHGSELTADMTGYTPLGVSQGDLEVMTPPVSPGYWRGDTPDEFAETGDYVYNVSPSNKGGIVPAGGMTIDGYSIPAGIRVVQFRDFSAGDFSMDTTNGFMFRGCRFRGASSAPGYFNCAPTNTGKLYFFFNDLGGLGSAPGDFNEVPIDIKGSDGVIVYRNRIQYTTTGVQLNIASGEITENFISDLTTFGTAAHLNGITHNGGETNSLILRNNIVIRTPDASGRAVVQTDCISYFQDFGTFLGAGTNRDGSVGYKIDSNYVGGTGFCIYAGKNAGSGGTTVQNMVVTNNKITTLFYPDGGFFGVVSAEPPWGTLGNVKSNNTWADGPDAGSDAF